MDSVGIPEGTVFDSEFVCECIWLCLTSYPPKYKLEKKCDLCREKENNMIENGETIEDK